MELTMAPDQAIHELRVRADTGCALRELLDRPNNVTADWFRHTNQVVKMVFRDQGVHVECDRRTPGWVYNWPPETQDPWEGVRWWIHEMVWYLEKLAYKVWQENPEVHPTEDPVSRKKVFLVHGRDLKCRDEVADFLRENGRSPIVLSNEANKGMHLTDKLVGHSDVSAAIVLLTPDDEGRLFAHGETPGPRCRQNVIFEWGFFVGKLGQGCVHVLAKGNVGIPSDLEGIARVIMDETDSWKEGLRKELS